MPPVLRFALDAGAEGKAWLIYQWQTHARAGAITRPREAILPGPYSTRPSRLLVHDVCVELSSAYYHLPRGASSQVVARSHWHAVRIRRARKSKQGCRHHHQALCVRDLELL